MMEYLGKHECKQHIHGKPIILVVLVYMNSKIMLHYLLVIGISSIQCCTILQLELVTILSYLQLLNERIVVIISYYQEKTSF